MIFREETFAAVVAPLFRFKTEEEAIRLANDTEFGLARRISMHATWGGSSAWPRPWNTGSSASTRGSSRPRWHPFGGMKSSGLGREGSSHGIEDYLEIKYLALGGIGTW